MPFILIVAGIIIFVTAINGTTATLGRQISTDVFGSGGFLYWFVAIMIVGAIGYVGPLKKLSDIFLLLLLVSLTLSNKGVFTQFNTALGQISTAAQNASTTSAASGLTGTGLTGAAASAVNPFLASQSEISGNPLDTSLLSSLGSAGGTGSTIDTGSFS